MSHRRQIIYYVFVFTVLITVSSLWAIILSRFPPPPAVFVTLSSGLSLDQVWVSIINREYKSASVSRPAGVMHRLLTWNDNDERRKDVSIWKQVVAVFKALFWNLQAVTGATFERGTQLHVDIVFSNKQPQMFNKFLHFYGTQKFSTVFTTIYQVRRRV